MNFQPTHLLPLAIRAFVHAADSACLKRLADRGTVVSGATLAATCFGAVEDAKPCYVKALKRDTKLHFREDVARRNRRSLKKNSSITEAQVVHLRLRMPATLSTSSASGPSYARPSNKNVNFTAEDNQPIADIA
jgi:hypothetical protein